MLNVLVADGYPKFINMPTALIYGLIGFLVVFFGISLLILVISLVGKVMKKTPTNNPPSKKKEVPVSVPVSVPQTKANADEIDDETLAVITAALMACYEKQGSHCEFRVKRIRKI